MKKNERGESDEVLTIYTKDFGRLEILAKAVRKIKSKLRAGADLFYLSEIEFIQGKGRKTLTDAVLIEKFANIGKDLKKLKVAHKIAEVFDELVRGQERDENLWNLLDETFDKLNNPQLTSNGLRLSYYFFLWNFFSLLGYSPELYNCSLCQRKLAPAKLFFGSEQGGVICEQCRNLVKLTEEVDIDTVKILRILLKKNWQTLLLLKIEKPHFRKLKEISKNYYLYLSGELTT